MGLIVMNIFSKGCLSTSVFTFSKPAEGTETDSDL